MFEQVTPRIGMRVQFNAPLSDPHGTIVQVISQASRDMIYIITDDLKRWECHANNQRLDVSDHSIGKWTAIDESDKNLVECQRLQKEYQDKVDAENAKRELQQSENDLKRLAFEAKFNEICPTWAKAVIIACLDVDTSRAEVDHYGYRTEKYVFLAWSATARNNFKECREAGRKYEPTRALANGPKEYEHRDNYANGEGYYLKANWINSSGWRIVKRPLDNWFYGHYSGDLSILISEHEKAKVAPVVQTQDATEKSGMSGVEVRENEEKNGVEIHFPSKPDVSVLTTLKSAGFHWSKYNRCWYIKRTPETLALAKRLIAQ